MPFGSLDPIAGISAPGDRDKVKKEFDHAMDEIRYFVATVVAPEAGEDFFFAGYVERRV